jgi:hypothetical protein
MVPSFQASWKKDCPERGVMNTAKRLLGDLFEAVEEG